MNYQIQDAIVAFVDSIRPMGQAQADLYHSVVHDFAVMVSNYLTSIGLPPR